MAGIELVSGAILGVVFQQLYEEATKKAKARCSNFTPTLDSLEKRIDLLTPKIEEMDRLKQQLDDYPRDDIRVFLQQLEKARNLVDSCSDISNWKIYKKHKYERRLKEPDLSLEKLSNVELQAAQALDIKRVILDVIQTNKKLDKMNLPEPGSSSSSSSSSSRCFETDIRFHIRYGSDRK